MTYSNHYEIVCAFFICFFKKKISIFLSIGVIHLMALFDVCRPCFKMTCVVFLCVSFLFRVCGTNT